MASQNEQLLVAVFRQLAVTKLDYGMLGKDLGLSREAARNRWVRFQAKIMQSAKSNNTASGAGGTSVPQTPPQTPWPKKKRSIAAKTKTSSAKKRKRAVSEESDDVDMHKERKSQVQPEVLFEEYIEAETKLNEDVGIAALINRDSVPCDPMFARNIPGCFDSSGSLQAPHSVQNLVEILRSRMIGRPAQNRDSHIASLYFNNGRCPLNGWLTRSSHHLKYILTSKIRSQRQLLSNNYCNVSKLLYLHNLGMASENQIMAAVLSQLSVTQLDFQRLADDIGLSNSEAARSRWRRLKAKLDESVAATPMSSPSKAPVTSPSARKDIAEKNGNGKRARVADTDDIEDDDHHDTEKKDVGKDKRGRGRPRRAVVEKSKAIVPDDDYEEEDKEEGYAAVPSDGIVDDEE